MMIAALTVTGSTGTQYTITVDPTTGNPKCTCPAFYYTPGRTKACKHIKFAAEAMAGSPAEGALRKLEV